MKVINFQKRIFIAVLSLFAFFLCSSPVSAQTQDQVKRDLKIESEKDQICLLKIGRMPENCLSEKLPKSFEVFQTGWFNVQGQYMSEVDGIRKFVAEAKTVLAEINKTNSANYDFTDLLIALFKVSPNKRLAAANGYLVIDSFYHSHVGKELIKELIYDGSNLNKHLEARRLFSNIHAMIAQSSFLEKPFTKLAAGTPPKIVQLAIKTLSKIPGEHGRAINDTLSLMGVESLTSSIFAEYAKKRLLSDPKLRARIIALHDRLLSIQQSIQYKGAKNFQNRTIWSEAMIVCKNPADAIELIGVFTTQHRTLPKTILPRVESRDEQLPIIAPLIRSTANFFLVQEINELTKNSNEYLFSYPIGNACDDPRYYHFWAEAFIAWKLLEKGYKPEIVSFCTHNLGKAYETYTLPANTRFAIKSDAELKNVLEGWHKDIESHKKGSDFALQIWKMYQKNQDKR
ncbi:MAG: hypothetical protein HQM10_25340 [Candidatus Riflebacteria bacterium]|nr:hypothetical protein [Candidatus Riflebacteria bacterium]